ncbi:MAG TPA: hypothetical protein VI114_07210, partial [Chthoniobacterales bacterium]
RSQKSEVRSQKSEVRSQKSEVRSQKSEVRSQKSERFFSLSLNCKLRMLVTDPAEGTSRRLGGENEDDGR